MSGLFAAGGLVYVAPAVNLERERSINKVNPNGGIVEKFHANLPGDRIMAVVGGAQQTWPDGLYWPESLDVDGSQTEIFKLRNEEDKVVGVASRIKASGPDESVEWTVHMPARGTLYALFSGRPDGDGIRPGRLRAGSLEFESRSGAVYELFDSTPGTDESREGRLMLTTVLVNDAYESDFEDETVAGVSQ